MSSLEGRIVINTRPEGQQEELSLPLRARGASVLEFPLLRIVPAADLSGFMRRLDALEPADWIVFTSRNAAEAVSPIAGRLSRHKLAAIGRKTASALKKIGCPVDFISPAADSVSFARALLELVSHEEHPPRMLLARGSNALDDLPRLLRRRLSVEEETVYDALVRAANDDEVEKLIVLMGGNASSVLLVLTSARGVKLMQEAGENRSKVDEQSWVRLIKQIPSAVIGGRTAAAAREAGFNVVVSAPDASVESLIQSIEQYYSR